MVNNKEQNKMTQANIEVFVVGTEVELKDASLAKKYGRSRIISIERAPRSANTTFKFESIETGNMWHWKFRMYLPEAANRLATHVDVAKKATAATVKKAVETRNARIQRDVAAYEDVIIKQGIQPGDIVTITTPKDKYDFKVCEIDYSKGRLKGFNVNTSYHNVGSRMGWANYKHPEVSIKLKQKKAFDVSLDACYNQHKAEAAETGEKRAVTRARRKAIRNHFGF
jgi:hypothetical protein